MRRVEVAAAIIVKEDKILATKRGYGDYKGYWEFPGGKVEPGETKEAALKREIIEELDSEIEILRIYETIEYDYNEFHLTMHCFLCKLRNDNFKLLEHQEARWMRKEELSEVSWLPADLELIEQLKRG